MTAATASAKAADPSACRRQRALAVSQHQRGVGLIEVLVALLVMSIGLLGVANLHLAGLRHTQDAYLHSQATVLAQDIIDRMRANREAAVSGTAYTPIAFDESQPEDCSPVTLSGSIANRDIALWKQALVCNLPDGDGMIAHAGNGVYRVVIRWAARDTESGFDLITTEVQL